MTDQVFDIDYLIKSMEKELNENIRIHSNCSIFKVPVRLRRVNETAYTPQLVAIGPLHKRKGNLGAMEKQKLQYLHEFSSRLREHDIGLGECITSVSRQYEKVIGCYADAEKMVLRKDELIRMMVLDGCFILEVFLKHCRKDFSKDDTIFNTPWMLLAVQRDLVLLENQIPFFILDCLYCSVVDLMSPRPLNFLAEMALSFLELDKSLAQKEDFPEVKHLLDLLRHSFILSSRMVTTVEKYQKEKFVHCARELSKAGITFKKKGEDANLLDIEFNNGTLELPAVEIGHLTETQLRNMIALEHCCRGYTQNITSYAVFMYSLINSAQDVELLQRKRIIINYLGGHKQVSNLFNTLPRGVVVTDFYYNDLCDKVDKYYKSFWHKTRATLFRDYFDNPWMSISVVAAFVLLAVTILQTVYSVISYYAH